MTRQRLGYAVLATLSLVTSRGLAQDCSTAWATFDTVNQPSWGIGFIISDGLVCDCGVANAFVSPADGSVCTIELAATHSEGVNRYMIAMHEDADGVPLEPALAEWFVQDLPLTSVNPSAIVVIDATPLELTLRQGETYWVSMRAAGGGDATQGALLLSTDPNATDTPIASFQSDTHTWTNSGNNIAGSIRVTADNAGDDFFLQLVECPNPLTLSVRNATPNNVVGFFLATRRGQVVIPGGFVCAGTQLDLGTPIRFGGIALAGPDGDAFISMSASSRSCGFVFQALDVATCNTSNVVQ